MIRLSELIEPYKIFCDLDGTLTDFDKAFFDITGITTSEYKKNHTKEEFWNEVKKGGLEYWSKMPWMPDGKRLWKFIRKRAIILSAPASRIPESAIGKGIWVRNNLGPNVKLILKKAEEKRQFSNSKSILIDDEPDNIHGWIADGGIGILHKSANDTIAKLKHIFIGEK